MKTSCDVAIVGGGPVGAALAISLARDGMRVALVEGREPRLPDAQSWDSRVYAVSPGSRALLMALGAWQRMAAERISPINGMRVWGDDGQSNIVFDALEAGAEDLGCIVEAGRLQRALWDGVRNEAGVAVYCPARCESLELHDSAGVLSLVDGTHIDAALIVGADGPDSWVRSAAGLMPEIKAYGQTAVVANFATERPHGQIARQWFRQDGVIAWLPLPGDRISIVWSVETALAEELLSLAAEALCERVMQAGNGVLGRLELLAPAAAFPLRLVDVPRAVKPGVALVGDAAHVVHPLAGQGVNLGFRDVQALADALHRRGRHEAAGDLTLLRVYERARREDWLATKWVTDGLQRLFKAERQELAVLRNRGLALVDRLPGLKRRFMAHAMQ